MLMEMEVGLVILAAWLLSGTGGLRLALAVVIGALAFLLSF